MQDNDKTKCHLTSYPIPAYDYAKRMKKVAATLSSLAYLLSAGKVWATHGPGHIEISPPPQGFKTIGNFVTNLLTFAFAIGVLVVLIMLIWGAFEWITSGGDKDHVASARNRIINALIGLAVLAIAFALARLASQFVGINLLDITVPGPS